MKLGIEGKVALVLGAAGGLGSAIAAELAAEGVRVAAAARTADRAEAVADRLRASGTPALGLGWDLADLGVADDRIGRIEAELGTVDILVNNTGGPPPGPAAGQTLETWRRYVDAMVLPVIAVTDRVLPAMRAQGWGRVITSTSSGVVAPIPNLGLSNALRASLLGWSKTLAREVGPDGVTCNIVVPGRIATARVRALDEAKAAREGRPVESVVRESVASIPVGRYGDPREYAQVVTFLASMCSAFVNGSVIRVDGGMIPSI
ncbi:3-oxoacyl-ACP reductase [Acrocarpospora pleiomorpha]|uniref:3-oxoacyl-ACP reductase n=1 Tax=Acrocarpospora pleiomorpha TaxID=90975 RepID=A0A5M3X9C8_9ACTN|nr:SDR family oxidoreductase [Acrocarpospora pleiomorpha]GES17256.1 3-oxoacyl-ACP reductase [Acrocarpospora pleiomorpha]